MRIKEDAFTQITIDDDYIIRLNLNKKEEA